MTDAIVIGSGPNGLVAANKLADAGWSVKVLEASEHIGGAVRTAELTVPGFKHDVFSAFYPLARASPVITAMNLEDYGLAWREAPLVLAYPFADGRCAVISRDIEVTAASLDSFAPGDGSSWKLMIEEWQRVEAPLLDLLLRGFPPLRPAAALALRLGALDSVRFLRHALLPVRRMAEERFKGQGGRILLGGLALHADLTPESAGSGFYGWLLACVGQSVGFPVPEGGAGRLTEAMAARLAAHGGQVVCRSKVVEILVSDGRATGVRTEDGRVLEAARAVLADVAAPSLYGSLVGRHHLPSELLRDLEAFEWDAATVKIDWALSEPVPWTAVEARNAGTIHLADDFDNLTESSSQIAMGRLPARPFVLFGQQSIADPSRSPPGTDTAWAYTHVPQHIRGDAEDTSAGVWRTGGEDWVARFVERVEARIEALAPSFSEVIIGRHVHTPGSLEAENANLAGGAIGGGTAQLHQQLIFRPYPGMGRPETPIAGLYLASASAHPGAGVHGAAGANAARAALLPGARLRARIAGRGGGLGGRRY